MNTSRSIGPASGLRAMLDAGAIPLVQTIGLAPPADIEFDKDFASATIYAGKSTVALLVVGWGEPLQRYWRSAVEHAVHRSARWCVLFNGIAMRIVDTAYPRATRFTEFDLELASGDEESAAAMRYVCARLDGRLDSIVRQSDRHGVAVCQSLKDGVLSASSDVLAALAISTRRRRGVDVHTAFDQALTIVYRVLFLLFAESRRLVPLWHRVYRESYSIEALVDVALREADGRGLWDALRAIARLAHSGCRAGDLRVTAFNGRLFSPTRTPLAERRDLDNERARRALISLSTRASTGGSGRERIAYRDLGVEQLGSVYESLLDYQPSANPVRLLPGSGVRKTTGTFYTPQPIAEYIVRRSLSSLVQGATAHDILGLRVVDPAMGSGAFLVAACHYLTSAYEAALVREGSCLASDIGDVERAGIRRTIAERCLYGVDINPMAVQLARLSLWLTTLAADRPLTFLDHRLQSGDSLIGAWMDNLRRAPKPMPRRRHETDATPSLFEHAAVQSMLRDTLPVRFSLECTPDDTLEQVRAKEHALTALLRRDSPLSLWKRIADVWCSAWMSAASAVPADAFGALTDSVLRGRGSLPAQLAVRYLSNAADIASTRRFFHWELEFPEVFFEAKGHRLSRPGFDAVIGNPPWEVVRGDVSALRFTRQSGVYSASSGGHGNLYQVFTERAISLLRDGGRLGLVLPSGLATDHGSARLRRRLMQDCELDAIVGLDNQRGVFSIHRSVKFLLVTATKGSPTRAIACRFGESDPAALDFAPDGRSTSPWFRVRLRPDFLQRVSGDSLAIPELRTTTDVAIAERGAALFVPLGSDRGWAAQFGRELNATDDRTHFGTNGLPIVEGKHIAPFHAALDRCTQHVTAAAAGRLLTLRPFEHPRLAYRDVAGATNRLTLIAAVLPANCVSTHTVFCLRTRLPLSAQHFLCGLFNSLVVNYFVRLRVTTHVTTATIEQLPVPPPGHAPLVQREIGALARLLSRRVDVAAWARLNACVAALYQLTRAEFEHVLTTFPLVPESDRAAALVAYREHGA